MAEMPPPEDVGLPPGPWTGEGLFTQSWTGVTGTARQVVTIVVDKDGAPEALPALGLVSPWGVYGTDRGVLDFSPAETLEQGGTAWAYCRVEAGGTANKIAIESRGHSAKRRHVQWSYRASYRFADLIEYLRYDYTDPDAPQVTVEAREEYRLDDSDGVETLRVFGQAKGVSETTGEAVVLRFEARLTRGASMRARHCRLGAP
jgi:hypothetical protein